MCGWFIFSFKESVTWLFHIEVKLHFSSNFSGNSFEYSISYQKFKRQFIFWMAPKALYYRVSANIKTNKSIIICREIICRSKFHAPPFLAMDLQVKQIIKVLWFMFWTSLFVISLIVWFRFSKDWKSFLIDRRSLIWFFLHWSIMADEVFEEDLDSMGWARQDWDYRPRFKPQSIGAVHVAHIYGIGLFYGLALDNAKIRDDMIMMDSGLAEMKRVPLTRSPQPNKIYAAIFSEDECVYRCMVTKT